MRTKHEDLGSEKDYVHPLASCFFSHYQWQPCEIDTPPIVTADVYPGLPSNRYYVHVVGSRCDPALYGEFPSFITAPSFRPPAVIPRTLVTFALAHIRLWPSSPIFSSPVNPSVNSQMQNSWHEGADEHV